jgi:hypothetical protein
MCVDSSQFAQRALAYIGSLSCRRAAAPHRQIAGGAILSALLLNGIAGCTPLTIRDARNTPGTIPALKEYLEGAPQRVVIVLVHGVGDHCPTYGLDANQGWLRDATTTGLGLYPAGPVGTPELISDPDNRAEDGAVDPGSAFYLTRRQYSYQRADGRRTDVEVGEITWSGVTAWIKAKQLSFDLSDAAPAGDSSVPHAPIMLSCPEIPAGPYPFSRQSLNKSIKEPLLDLALSDAILYVGPYGVKIEHGVAEVLCRLLSDKSYDSKQRCHWHDVSEAATSSRFLFMTHSLGSRIVYDTLIDLAGQAPTRAGISVFSDKEAGVKVRKIIANTSAVYMFANQLPLLGLANVPVTLRSGDPSGNYLEITDLSTIPSLGAKEGSASVAGDVDRTLRLACAKNRIACLAALKGVSAASLGETRGRLDIVAFSDPNDLLSWPIPEWYLKDSDTLKLQITNVTLQNAFHWFGLLEWPESAHDDYMSNSTVWDVIKCGAVNGKSACNH